MHRDQRDVTAPRVVDRPSQGFSRRFRPVDADDHRELAKALDVSIVPTLVLLRGRKVLGRLDGRVTGNDITRLIRPFVGTGSRAGA